MEELRSHLDDLLVRFVVDLHRGDDLLHVPQDHVQVLVVRLYVRERVEEGGNTISIAICASAYQKTPMSPGEKNERKQNARQTLPPETPVSESAPLFTKGAEIYI